MLFNTQNIPLVTVLGRANDWLMRTESSASDSDKQWHVSTKMKLKETRLTRGRRWTPVTCILRSESAIESSVWQLMFGDDRTTSSSLTCNWHEPSDRHLYWSLPSCSPITVFVFPSGPCRRPAPSSGNRAPAAGDSALLDRRSSMPIKPLISVTESEADDPPSGADRKSSS